MNEHIDNLSKQIEIIKNNQKEKDGIYVLVA